MRETTILCLAAGLFPAAAACGGQKVDLGGNDAAISGDDGGSSGSKGTSSSSGSGGNSSSSSGGSGSGSGGSSGSSGGSSSGSGGMDAFTGSCAGEGVATTIMVGPNGMNAFQPTTVTVKVGDTVEWIFDSVGHTVTGGPFCTISAGWCSPTDETCGASPTGNAGDTYCHTFTTAGTFPFFCRTHCVLGESGSVVVQ